MAEIDLAREKFANSYALSRLSRFDKSAYKGAKGRQAKANWMKNWREQAYKAYDDQQEKLRESLMDEMRAEMEAKFAEQAQAQAAEAEAEPEPPAPTPQPMMQPMEPLNIPQPFSSGSSPQGGQQASVPVWGAGGGGNLLSALLMLLSGYGGAAQAPAGMQPASAPRPQPSDPYNRDPQGRMFGVRPGGTGVAYVNPSTPPSQIPYSFTPAPYNNPFTQYQGVLNQLMNLTNANQVGGTNV